MPRRSLESPMSPKPLRRNKPPRTSRAVARKPRKFIDGYNIERVAENIDTETCGAAED